MALYDTQSGSSPIRAEVVDSMVKQIAERAYKFKQAVAIVPTSAWKNTFFREQTDIPAGQTGNATKGIPRGANFPQYALSWQEVSVRIVKHGLEDNIPWEDILSDDINVQARTIIRLTEGVVKSVDDDIYSSLTEAQTGASIGTATLVIQSYAIDQGATGRWDETSASIVNDFMQASRLIAEANYDTSDLICFINPYQHQYLIKYLSDKGAQYPSISQDVTTNGRIGRLAGINLVVSNSVSTSFALVVKPKVCGTYKELVSLRSTTVDDPYKSVKVRVVEEGVVELTDPLAVCLISNTQKNS